MTDLPRPIAVAMSSFGCSAIYLRIHSEIPGFNKTFDFSNPFSDLPRKRSTPTVHESHSEAQNKVQQTGFFDLPCWRCLLSFSSARPRVVGENANLENCSRSTKRPCVGISIGESTWSLTTSSKTRRRTELFILPEGGFGYPKF